MSWMIFTSLALTKRAPNPSSATYSATNHKSDMRMSIGPFNFISYKEEESHSMAFSFGCTRVCGIRVNVKNHIGFLYLISLFWCIIQLSRSCSTINNSVDLDCSTAKLLSSIRSVISTAWA